jgi:DNA-directed RNA polymerase specialized sigma24 family protein
MNGDETPEDRMQRERVGVSGDPVPDHEYGDDREDLTPDVAPDEAGEGVSPSVRAAARRLSDPGLLTDRQALAYVLRDVEDVGRQEAADRLGCSTSNLDGLLGTARRKLERARHTLEEADDLRAE